MVATAANVVLLAWLGIEVWRIRQARRQGGAIEDAGTFARIWVFVALAFVLGDAAGAWAGPRWRLGPAAADVGLALIVAGVAFRQYAIQVLGRHFSPRVRIDPHHRLVERGPYRWVRHPAYTGAWAALVGVGLLTRSVPAVLVYIVVAGVGFINRIHVEERVLRGHFGAEYDAYARRTWRLLPFVY